MSTLSATILLTLYRMIQRNPRSLQSPPIEFIGAIRVGSWICLAFGFQSQRQPSLRLVCCNVSHLVQLPGDLDYLRRSWVIALAAVPYIVEFLTDKVPIVDLIWDAIHTLIRVPAGAVLAAAAFATLILRFVRLHCSPAAL